MVQVNKQKDPKRTYVFFFTINHIDIWRHRMVKKQGQENVSIHSFGQSNNSIYKNCSSPSCTWRSHSPVAGVSGTHFSWPIWRTWNAVFTSWQLWACAADSVASSTASTVIIQRTFTRGMTAFQWRNQVRWNCLMIRDWLQMRKKKRGGSRLCLTFTCCTDCSESSFPDREGKRAAASRSLRVSLNSFSMWNHSEISLSLSLSLSRSPSKLYWHYCKHLHYLQSIQINKDFNKQTAIHRWD